MCVCCVRHISAHVWYALIVIYKWFDYKYRLFFPQKKILSFPFQLFKWLNIFFLPLWFQIDCGIEVFLLFFFLFLLKLKILRHVLTVFDFCFFHLILISVYNLYVFDSCSRINSNQKTPSRFPESLYHI